ncbi:polysaccharide deacetylase family protein [Sphaerisporangium fuscum]|uniref:polysaccharide deacetylase family protein n=1 Tax=Sphaerisporangium fuscum TaxID=2835868 RepID=UPI002029B315|nr:polysaccharide deacetylase family protein [Sphaerisporangium fuscum]
MRSGMWGRGTATRSRVAGVLALAAALLAGCGTSGASRTSGTAYSRASADGPAQAARPLVVDRGLRAHPKVLRRDPRPGPPHPVPSASAASPTPTVPVAEEAPDCHKVKCVALTFDDGPGPYTDKLLRELAAYRAPATFFLVGRNVAGRPDVVRRTVEAGHEIGDHTWSHPDLTRLSAARIRSQLGRTDRAIEKAAGVVPAIVRPPYGAVNRTVRRQVTRPLVLWNVDTEDWRYRNSARVARAALKDARPGSVILFHDIRPTTVKAIPRVLKTLSKRGYRFVTISEMFGGKPPRLVYGGPGPKAR